MTTHMNVHYIPGGSCRLFLVSGDPIQFFTKICTKVYPEKNFRIGFNPDTFELRCAVNGEVTLSTEILAPVPTYSHIEYGLNILPTPR